ncbi:MAG: riboflavin biosynthesis protein RibF [Chloroflexota bacterium]
MSEQPVRRSVATIGVFDGVPLGHQHLLGLVRERARERGAEALAVSFEPHPMQVLRPEQYMGRLCTPEQKAAALLAAGADRVRVIPFTRETAGLEPEQFMRRLAEEDGLVHLLIGADFALGRNRAGDAARLSEIGRDLGYTVEVVDRVPLGEETLSSTVIRQAIAEGDAARARRLMGRPFRVSGEVVHGKHLGREIGFPTANVEPPDDLVAIADGIYAAHAWLPGDRAPRPAITYIGQRPTVNTGPRVIETHLLDFDGDLYGQHIEVDLLQRIRPDAHFPSLEALIGQMRVDEAQARAVLAREG